MAEINTIRLRHAVEAIRGADALLIGAGAGMGVDSGLPDFRGPEGLWNAYPPLRGKTLPEVSTPHWFTTDPEFAWGFFGHRLHLYRSTLPHAGFGKLRHWSQRMSMGAYVFTSNVDGQFQKAGFSQEEIMECHGSIHFLQCTRRCGSGIWPADLIRLEVDELTLRAQPPLPSCPDCGSIARPNILMFGDGGWDSHRTRLQANRYQRWLNEVAGRKVVAIEIGAGLAIPTVRMECERHFSLLIRINPRDPDTRGEGISLPMGAWEAIRQLDDMINEMLPFR